MSWFFKWIINSEGIQRINLQSINGMCNNIEILFSLFGFVVKPSILSGWMNFFLFFNLMRWRQFLISLMEIEWITMSGCLEWFEMERLELLGELNLINCNIRRVWEDSEWNWLSSWLNGCIVWTLEGKHKRESKCNIKLFLIIIHSKWMFWSFLDFKKVCIFFCMHGLSFKTMKSSFSKKTSFKILILKV
jgi:hypothetical protein